MLWFPSLCFYGFCVCLCVCVCVCVYMCFSLFLFDVVVYLSVCFINERRYEVGWVGEVGRIWEEMRRETDQNILYGKFIFSNN